MKSVLGLLLLLFATPSYGLESTICDATQNASVCYGALGEPVRLQVMKRTRGYELNLYSKEQGLIFTISEGTVSPSRQFPEDRWQVVARIGTLIINPAERSDSRKYTVAIYSGNDHSQDEYHYWLNYRPPTLLRVHSFSLLIKELESVCNATQDASVCYGAPGGPVMLQLMRNTRGYELKFRDEKGNTVFTLSKGRVSPSSRFPKGRWQVVAGNGTLIIYSAERNDSGTYTVEIYREDTQTIVGRHTVQLVIEGISPVVISVIVVVIIVLASLLVGGCYLHKRRKRTHTAGENQEVALSPIRESLHGEGPQAPTSCSTN